MTTAFGIPENVLYATAGVYALLILASSGFWQGGDKPSAWPSFSCGCGPGGG
jgi:hypothetical protein